MRGAPVLALLALGCARGPDAPLRVEAAEVRVTPAGVGAGALRIVNPGRAPDRLLAVASPDARRIEVHALVEEGGVVRMVPQPEGVVVPARGHVELAPDRTHLMVYGLGGAARAVRLSLRFERAGTLVLDAPVHAF